MTPSTHSSNCSTWRPPARATPLVAAHVRHGRASSPCATPCVGRSRLSLPSLGSPVHRLRHRGKHSCFKGQARPSCEPHHGETPAGRHLDRQPDDDRQAVRERPCRSLTTLREPSRRLPTTQAGSSVRAGCSGEVGFALRGGAAPSRADRAQASIGRQSWCRASQVVDGGSVTSGASLPWGASVPDGSMIWGASTVTLTV